MKKFGTPTAAGPGWASEKVGLLAGGGAACAGGASTVLATSSFFCACLVGLRAFFFFLAPSSDARDLLVRRPVVCCCSCLPADGSSLGAPCFDGLEVGCLALGCLATGAADFGCGFVDGLDGVVCLDGCVVAGAGLGAAGAGGVWTVGTALGATAPRSCTLTTGIATPATVMLVGAVPGSPVHGTVVWLASVRT